MYGNLAAIYDRLMTIDYQTWADFLEAIFTAENLKVSSILDLACGTGAMALELAKRGYRLQGVDLSEEMLAVAERKLRPFGVPLFKGDMRKLPPLGQFDVAICLTDSLNYLGSIAELAEVFRGLQQMKPQLLIFDLNTPYYLAQVLGNNSFNLVEDDIAYIWENRFCPEEQVCHMEITFFERLQGDTFRRFAEYHVEKAFEFEQIKKVLKQTGWNLGHIYDGYTPEPAHEKSWRWLFTAKPDRTS